MPKRKTPEEKPEEQFKRFVEVARELEIDEREDVLSDAFERLSRKGGRQPVPKARKS